jgi:filamentous hemagglutinin
LSAGSTPIAEHARRLRRITLAGGTTLGLTFDIFREARSCDHDDLMDSTAPTLRRAVLGDGTKVGGTRVDPDLLCGKNNSRCMTNADNTLALNNFGQIVFKGDLAAFLESDEGKKMAGPTGGIQGAKGTLFGVPYSGGSWQDQLIEAFSGTHDTIGGKLTGLYNDQGNIKQGMNSTERFIYDNFVTTTAIPVAAPFAASELLPPEVWNAIAAILKVSK